MEVISQMVPVPVNEDSDSSGQINDHCPTELALDLKGIRQQRGGLQMSPSRPLS